MKKPDNRQRLRHILDAVAKIETYLQDFDKEKFQNDEKTSAAVTWQLAVIGEAVANLTRDFRSNNSQIAWNKISGTRNHLIHGYFSIDFDIVWETTQNDLPILKKQIEEILENLN
ncbi:DUF86 domain-containing protein [soil metagenome]